MCFELTLISCSEVIVLLLFSVESLVHVQSADESGERNTGSQQPGLAVW